MQTIRPLSQRMDVVCAETAADDIALIVFGASGDLSHRKLYISLFSLWRRGLLAGRFYILGCGRTQMSDEAFRGTVEKSVAAAAKTETGRLNEFAGRFHYTAGGYGDKGLYEGIRRRIAELDKTYGIQSRRIFYLAVPPQLYETIAENLELSKLSCPAGSERMRQTALAIEKPFGSDLESAQKLEHRLGLCFDESQIYRIDHYLGKETVQNMLVFRFANSLFEPIWNRSYIDHVQITIAENVGVEHRAGYYDKTGAMRDMFQNHLLQMMALIAMEPPSAFEAETIRDERAKLLRSITPIEPEQIEGTIVAGQYGPGTIDGRGVCGYRQEQGVGPDSKTETFIAAKLTVDNWRWKDVPFYLRTGKRMCRKLAEMAIVFKPVPHSMFHCAGLDAFEPNVLRFRIQPQEAMSLSILAKRPGSKLCMSVLNLAVDYKQVFGVEMPDAYERLLLDCMLGDQTLFTRRDGIMIAWRLLQPALDCWPDKRIFTYPAGAGAMPAADALIQKDGRNWLPLCD